MRIALDTQSTLGRKTGIGQSTASLLAALRKIAPQHTWLSLNWGKEPSMRLDRRLRWQQWELPRLARQQHADLLHLPGFDAPFLKPCPTVLTVNDLIGMIFPQHLPPASRFYWSRWLPQSVHRADQIIAISEHTRQDIVRLLGIPAAKINVIPLAADPAFHPLEDSEQLESIRQKYRLPAPLILYVGTLEPRKGLDTLLTAFQKIQELIPHHLVLAGKPGWYTERLFQQVNELHLEARVHFTNYVEAADLPGLYNLADLFVFPSRYEGFGLPPLEAMACGTPVVASNASSLPEVIGEAGLLVEPDHPAALADAILQALSDTALHAVLRTRGLMQAAKFNWEETARRTLGVYEEFK